MNRTYRQMKAQEKRQAAAQQRRIEKTDGQESILKWLSKAAAVKPIRYGRIRPVLTWGYCTTLNNQPIAVATDEYRLHCSWVGIDGLPQWVALKNSLPKTEAAEYPDFRTSIPADVDLLSVLVHPVDLLKAIKRARVFARHNGNRITLMYEDRHRSLAVKGAADDIGNCTTYLDCYNGGLDFTVSLKAQQLLDALSIWEPHERVRIGVPCEPDPSKPIVMGEYGYKLALMMPMRSQ